MNLLICVNNLKRNDYAAAHWCVDNGYAKTYNGGVRSHISNAAKHKTKTAYGYRWEYAQ